MAPDRDADFESPLGAFIRHQRGLQKLSMRQPADLAGISNPYLSQIERGRRRPGGNGDDDEEPPVVAASRADPRLTARQRQALLEVYGAFVSRRGAKGGAQAPR